MLNILRRKMVTANTITRMMTLLKSVKLLIMKTGNFINDSETTLLRLAKGIKISHDGIYKRQIFTSGNINFEFLSLVLIVHVQRKAE